MFWLILAAMIAIAFLGAGFITAIENIATAWIRARYGSSHNETPPQAAADEADELD